jgi:beta-lactamase regulating signal transducer with metallopeptidase domain
LIGSLILWLTIAIIVIAVFVYIVNWLYHRKLPSLRAKRSNPD